MLAEEAYDWVKCTFFVILIEIVFTFVKSILGHKQRLWIYVCISIWRLNYLFFVFVFLYFRVEFSPFHVIWFVLVLVFSFFFFQHYCVENEK